MMCVMCDVSVLMVEIFFVFVLLFLIGFGVVVGEDFVIFVLFFFVGASSSLAFSFSSSLLMC